MKFNSFFVTGLSSKNVDIDPASITESHIGQEQKKGSSGRLM